MATAWAGSDRKRLDADPGPKVQAVVEKTPQGASAKATAGAGPRDGAEVLDRLWTLVESRRGADPALSHAARLLARGRVRVAQKLGEEALECVVEIIVGNRAGLVGESADVLYHLLLAWVDAGIRPEEVWEELRQREQASRLAERATKGSIKGVIGQARRKIGTTKIP